jgi:hypothetical protein
LLIAGTAAFPKRGLIVFTGRKALQNAGELPGWCSVGKLMHWFGRTHLLSVKSGGIFTHETKSKNAEDSARWHRKSR